MIGGFDLMCIKYRIMGALWLPLDNFNCCSTSIKSSICFYLPWLDCWNFMLGHWSSGDILFIQFNISGS